MREDFELEEIPYKMLLKLEVTMDDFMEALKEVEPSAIREVFTEIPDVNLKLLAQNAEGLVGGDMESICRKASMLAIREFLDNQKGKNDNDYTKFKIAAKHFNQAIKMVKENKKANSE